MKAYKVCSRQGSGWFSYMGKKTKANPRGLAVGVRYKIGEWVKPILKESRLFAFSTKELAEQFLFHEQTFDDEPLYLFECEVKDAKPLTKMSILITDESIQDFWSSYPNNGLDFDNTFVGTLGCSAIKLLKEIKECM